MSRAQDRTMATAATPAGARRAHPALSVLVALVWLALRESLTVADLLTAALLAWIVPRLVHGFLARPARPRGMVRIVRFTGVVLWDIVVSNFTVARIVLSPRYVPTPAWVRVDLELREDIAISLLATIITTTPGTVSCVIDEDEHVIWVHALDCADAEAAARDIKARYERPLAEIFES
jgi:multicomponent K+:H+ antiporter subunit E